MSSIVRAVVKSCAATQDGNHLVCAQIGRGYHAVSSPKYIATGRYITLRKTASGFELAAG